MSFQFPKLPADASETDKQAALASFRKALQDKMTQKSVDEINKLYEKFNKNEEIKQRLESGQDKSVMKQGLIDAIMQQQSRILDMVDLQIDIMDADWGKKVDDFLKDL